jgi:alcohol dehydrogenase, propanol-preferring
VLARALPIDTKLMANLFLHYAFDAWIGREHPELPWFARRLGAAWAGASGEMPPEPLDAAIIYAAVGDLVPLALEAVRKGGRVVCAGIHMSDIPRFPYSLLWEERQLVSVANLTRQDGLDFLRLVPEIGIVTKTTRSPLSQANQALADLRAGRFDGAAVLVP